MSSGSQSVQPAKDASAPLASTDSNSTLVDQKLEKEISKLDLEIAKLQTDLQDSRRSYLWRNPQVLPAGIAALGAVIGFGVATYVNYWNMLKERATHQQELAIAQKKDADILMSEAEKTRTKADRTRLEAEQAIASERQKIADAEKVANDRIAQIEQTAADKIAAAKAEVSETQTQVERVRGQLDLVNQDIFRLSGLPAFLNRQQRQLRYLGLTNVRSVTYAWISGGNLKGLSFGSPLGQNDVNPLSLSTLPRVEALGIESIGAAEIDIGMIPNVGSMKRLDVRLGQHFYPATTIRHLGLAQNVEILKIKMSGNSLVGMEDAADLKHLKQLSLTVDRASQVPKGVLGKITTLQLHGARPIDLAPITHEEYEMLSKSSHLEMLSIPGQIPADGSKLLKVNPNLKTLILSNANPDSVTGETWASVTQLYIGVTDVKQVSMICGAFPNLSDLALRLDTGPIKEKSEIEQLLKMVAVKYPLLHSMTLDVGLYLGSTGSIRVPLFGKLETLRFAVRPLNPSNQLTISLERNLLPSLHNIVIDANAIIPGQLLKLNPKYLVVNEVTADVLEELEKLSTVETLGIGTAARIEQDAMRAQEGPKSKGSIQTVIDRLPLKELVILGGDRFYELDHIPKSVEALDLDGDAFGLALGLNWYSDEFFKQTYGSLHRGGTN